MKLFLFALLPLLSTPFLLPPTTSQYRITRRATESSSSNNNSNNGSVNYFQEKNQILEEDEMLDLIKRHHKDHFSDALVKLAVGEKAGNDNIPEVIFEEREFKPGKNAKNDLSRFARKLNSAIKKGGVNLAPTYLEKDEDDSPFKYFSFTTSSYGGRVLGHLLKGETASNVEALLAVCDLAQRYGEKTVTLQSINSNANFPTETFHESWSKERERKTEMAKKMLAVMKRRQSVKVSEVSNKSSMRKRGWLIT